MILYPDALLENADWLRDGPTEVAPKAHHPVVKGYPEFNPGQDRDDTGRWSGGAATTLPDTWDDARKQEWLAGAAQEAGIDPGRIKLATEARLAKVGAIEVPVAAEVDWSKLEMTVRPLFWEASNPVTLRRMFAHEALHMRFIAVYNAYRAERTARHAHEVEVGKLSTVAERDQASHELPNGDLKPEYRDSYPLSAILDSTQWSGNTEQVAADASGLSSYARDWALAWRHGQAQTVNMLTEVISEVASAKAQGKAHYMAVTTKRLRDLYRAWNEAYEYHVAAASN